MKAYVRDFDADAFWQACSTQAHWNYLGAGFQESMSYPRPAKIFERQYLELSHMLETLVIPLALLRVPRTDFSTLSIKPMREHGFFNSIQELDLNRCRGVSSSMAQEILSSCPTPEVCSLGRIRISGIVSGKPWISTRMRIICINIDVESAVNDPDFVEQRHKAFEQFAVMTFIEGLAINERKPPIQTARTLNLRLKTGLELLTALSQLKRFWFKGDEWISIEDVDWIAGNF
ncbi:hypothetical protein BGX27_007808 [Mortierella sp. AM989]|nr:hypothetical protein BGX27_007808 [Mortierella sp. AM989]